MRETETLTGLLDLPCCPPYAKYVWYCGTVVPECMALWLNLEAKWMGATQCMMGTFSQWACAYRGLAELVGGDDNQISAETCAAFSVRGVR